ncbi:NmrA-like family protein [Beauveria brongniartii RCEF 3172]|uniref:NmrA-like family protein n=1 Tax=Beauveria brongniartii RCEF 3172 TaxID=1081107 RepID=A0A166XJJ9_9HYPO|nr:NmrA-like family protein [Beauveria brongniartii RCEF 3172]
MGRDHRRPAPRKPRCSGLYRLAQRAQPIRRGVDVSPRRPPRRHRTIPRGWQAGDREAGKQETLRLLLSEDAPVGIIDSDDVGILAAHLLVAEDVTRHNKAKYVLNGPENISGRHIVAMAEEYLGTKVETVAYKDTSFIEDMAAQSDESRNVILSIKHAADTVWEGKCGIDTPSKEVFNIAAPKRTPAQVFKTLLDE